MLGLLYCTIAEAILHVILDRGFLFLVLFCVDRGTRAKLTTSATRGWPRRRSPRTPGKKGKDSKEERLRNFERSSVDFLCTVRVECLVRQ